MCRSALLSRPPAAEPPQRCVSALGCHKSLRSSITAGDRTFSTLLIQVACSLTSISVPLTSPDRRPMSLDLSLGGIEASLLCSFPGIRAMAELKQVGVMISTLLYGITNVQIYIYYSYVQSLCDAILADIREQTRRPTGSLVYSCSSTTHLVGRYNVCVCVCVRAAFNISAG